MKVRGMLNDPLVNMVEKSCTFLCVKYDPLAARNWLEDENTKQSTIQISCNTHMV